AGAQLRATAQRDVPARLEGEPFRQGWLGDLRPYLKGRQPRPEAGARRLLDGHRGVEQVRVHDVREHGPARVVVARLDPGGLAADGRLLGNVRGHVRNDVRTTGAGAG